MFKKLIILIIFGVIILIGAGCKNNEEAFLECKTQCRAEIPITSGADRNACIQMCIEKYK